MPSRIRVLSPIAKCADTRDQRYSLSKVALRPSAGGPLAIATDGKIMAITRLEGELEEACYVEGQPLALCSDWLERDNGHWQSGNRRIVPVIPNDEVHFPQVTRILPEHVDENYLAVAVDWKLLSKALAACASKKDVQVTLFVPLQERCGSAAIVCVGSVGVALMSPMTGDRSAAAAAYQQLAAEVTD